MFAWWDATDDEFAVLIALFTIAGTFLATLLGVGLANAHDRKLEGERRARDEQADGQRREEQRTRDLERQHRATCRELARMLAPIMSFTDPDLTLTADDPDLGVKALRVAEALEEARRESASAPDVVWEALDAMAGLARSLVALRSTMLELSGATIDPKFIDDAITGLLWRKTQLERELEAWLRSSDNTITITPFADDEDIKWSTNRTVASAAAIRAEVDRAIALLVNRMKQSRVGGSHMPSEADGT